MTPRMAPVLERAADGDAGLNERPGASEDVSFFLNEVPGLYFNLGIVPRDQDRHSPGGALLTGGLSSSGRHSSCYAHARARTRPKLESSSPRFRLSPLRIPPH